MSKAPQTEFTPCPECGIGKMKPTGKFSVSDDPKTGRETGWERDYKCDNCGHPKDGVAKVLGVNEVMHVQDQQPSSQSPQQQKQKEAAEEETTI